MLPHKLGMRIIDRARMRLLLGDANFRQVLDQNLCFDLEFPGQLIYSDLIRICHQPLSLQVSLESTSVRFLPSPRLLLRPQLSGVAFLRSGVLWCPLCRVNPKDPPRARLSPRPPPERHPLRALQRIRAPRLLRVFPTLRPPQEHLALRPLPPAPLRLLQPARPVRPPPAFPAFRNMLLRTGESFQPSSRRCPESRPAVPASYPRASRQK